MRYSSVECTRVVPRRARRRLALLVCNKCRLPALDRKTLPLAVILNRLATDFFVLMPLGRRINYSLQKERAIYGHRLLEARAILADSAAWLTPLALLHVIKANSAS
jgi:hypothetical protein